MERDYHGYYVIATKDGADNRLYYYTGVEDFHGGMVWGDILDAHKFYDEKEVLEYLSKPGHFDLRFCILEIAGVTFEAMKEDAELHEKYRNPISAL